LFAKLSAFRTFELRFGSALRAAESELRKYILDERAWAGACYVAPQRSQGLCVIARHRFRVQNIRAEHHDRIRITPDVTARFLQRLGGQDAVCLRILSHRAKVFGKLVDGPVTRPPARSSVTVSPI